MIQAAKISTNCKLACKGVVIFRCANNIHAVKPPGAMALGGFFNIMEIYKSRQLLGKNKEKTNGGIK